METGGVVPTLNQFDGGDTRATVLMTNEITVRRLTPVECERLQGFPDNWTEGQADSNRYKQMGNAVAVPVVNWVVARLVANKTDFSSTDEDASPLTPTESE